MTGAGPTTPSTAKSITEHEAEEARQRDRAHAGGVRPPPLAVAEQLGPLGRAIPRERLRPLDAGLVADAALKFVRRFTLGPGPGVVAESAQHAPGLRITPRIAQTTITSASVASAVPATISSGRLEASTTSLPSAAWTGCLQRGQEGSSMTAPPMSKVRRQSRFGHV
jgi:hypothetical protein